MLTLDLLADERFDYAWPDCIEVLRRSSFFDDVVVALAEAPRGGLRERLWVTLGLPAETRVPEFLPEQSPATVVSCQFSWDCVSQDCGDDVVAHQCRHLPVVVALLGSSLEDVRQQAISALSVFGLGVVDALQSVPRSDQLARRGALTMLAEFGWNHLPPDDLVVLERLIRIKQKLETPEPLDFEHLSGSWYALPTTDQAAVLDAFDLRDPVPATLRMGFAPWQGIKPLTIHALYDWTDNVDVQAYLRDIYPQVFVTPALDGWTLVFYKDDTLGGNPEAPSTQKRFEIHLRMEQLSLRFGTVQWYEQFVDDYAPGCWSQWCVARDGEIRMHCVSSGDVRIYQSDEVDPTAPLDRLYAWLEANDHRRGPRPPQAETDRVEAYVNMLREHSDERCAPDSDDEHNLDIASPLQDQVFGARGASRRLSVSLEALGSHTRVQGTGVLAIPAHLQHRLRRGVLPI